MIKKVKDGYRVVAESGRNMGTYSSLPEAQKRLAQIEAFKQMRKKGAVGAKRPSKRTGKR